MCIFVRSQKLIWYNIKVNQKSNIIGFIYIMINYRYSYFIKLLILDGISKGKKKRILKFKGVKVIIITGLYKIANISLWDLLQMKAGSLILHKLKGDNS